LSLQPGTTVGPYEIVAPIGSGGMGEVYRALDRRLDREIAIKILSPELASRSDHLRRFEQEARAASSLNHPNIVTIYDVGLEGELAYIAMELIDGQDLRVMASKAPVTLNQAVRIISKVADGLAAAHDRGIVHRDLKPENIIISSGSYISSTGHVKILDFGLAKLVRPLNPNDTTLPHTHPGAVFGTVGYMSPEQASGLDTDFRTDHFSLGVILYELLTGHRPFVQPTAAETMAAIIRTEVPPVSHANPSVPPELERIVTRLLNKEPRDRYGSTIDLALDLREVRDMMTLSSGVRSSLPPLPAPRRKSMWPLAAIVAGIVLLGAASWYGLHMRTTAPKFVARSLGVLPFRDVSGVADGQLFADGIAETISAQLAQSSSIRITPLVDGSAKGTLRDIAKRRGADLLLRGSVQRAGAQLRVTYAIVDPASGSEIAGDTVTGAMAEVFALEDEVANRVLRTLGVTRAAHHATQAKLTGASQSEFVKARGLLVHVKDEHSADSAIDVLQSLLKDERDSAAVNAMLAKALMSKYMLSHQRMFLEEATLYSDRAVQLDPNLAEAQGAVGTSRRLSGRFPEAAASFTRAIQLDPKSFDSIAGLAETYAAMGRAADAERTFDRALALAPDSTNIVTRYATFCFAQGRYQKAAELYRRVTEMVPDGARGFTHLGAALQALGRYDDAAAAYERSIALAPSGSAYSNLGILRYDAGRYADACAALEKASALTPNDYRVWANLGDAYRWNPERRTAAPQAHERAIAAARATLSVNAKDALAHAVIASCLAKSGKLDEADREMRAALTIDPTDPDVLYAAAVVAQLRGDADAAANWLRRAVANGYSAAEAAHDPELASLRNREDVKQLVRNTKT
jgi:eukaryotic-like serine/threonine-protein kinase